MSNPTDMDWNEGNRAKCVLLSQQMFQKMGKDLDAMLPNIPGDFPSMPLEAVAAFRDEFFIVMAAYLNAMVHQVGDLSVLMMKDFGASPKETVKLLEEHVLKPMNRLAPIGQPHLKLMLVSADGQSSWDPQQLETMAIPKPERKGYVK